MMMMMMMMIMMMMMQLRVFTCFQVRKREKDVCFES